MKRPLAVLFLAFAAMVSTGTLAAQCAMCREAAAQNERQAEAFNHGILVLGAPPALVFAGVGLALWRRRDNRQSTSKSAGLQW